jgi:ABC-type multidrug transport system permease subunit
MQNEQVIGLSVIISPYFIFSFQLTLSLILLERLEVTQLIKKVPACKETQSFITTITKPCHWTLSWTSSVLSTSSYPIFMRFILILSSHICLYLPVGLFSYFSKLHFDMIFPYMPISHSSVFLRFPDQSVVWISYFLPCKPACPGQLILFDLITITVSD